MIKSVKTLLALCLFLLGLLFQSNGYAFYKSNTASSIKNSSCFTLQKSQHSISVSVLSNTKGQQQNHITDIEEKNNKITSFCTHIVESLFRNANIHLFLFKHLSYFSSCKWLYLLFETMQI